MLKADIFTGLSISQSSLFFKESDTSKSLKIAIQKCLESGKDLSFDGLKGWNKILSHKCNKNGI